VAGLHVRVIALRTMRSEVLTWPLNKNVSDFSAMTSVGKKEQTFGTQLHRR
jgi:hypothetical protein